MDTHILHARQGLRPESDLDRDLIRRPALDQLLPGEAEEELSPYVDGPGPDYRLTTGSADPAGGYGYGDAARVRLRWFERRRGGDDREGRRSATVLASDEFHQVAAVRAAGWWRRWDEHRFLVVDRYRQSDATEAGDGGRGAP